MLPLSFSSQILLLSADFVFVRSLTTPTIVLAGHSLFRSHPMLPHPAHSNYHALSLHLCHRILALCDPLCPRHPLRPPRLRLCLQCNVIDLVCGVMPGLLQQPLSQHAVEVRQCSSDAHEFPELPPSTSNSCVFRRRNTGINQRGMQMRGPAPKWDLEVRFCCAVLSRHRMSRWPDSCRRRVPAACLLLPVASGPLQWPPVPLQHRPCRVPDGWHLSNPT